MRSQSSGVAVHPDCVQQFNTGLKLGKKIKYMIFNLNKDNTEIVIEKTSDSGDYDQFVSELPEFECRWAIYDLEFEKEGGGIRNKIVFISWCVLLVCGPEAHTDPDLR